MSLSEAHTDLSPSRKGHVQTHPFSLERAGRGKSYVMRLKQYRCSELFRHKPWKASCGLGMWTLEKAYVGKDIKIKNFYFNNTSVFVVLVLKRLVTFSLGEEHTYFACGNVK